MSTRDDERELWQVGDVACVMVSCCAGAELQVRRGPHPDAEIVLRELYPTKSDLYERARELEAEHRRIIAKDEEREISRRRSSRL